MHVVNMRCIEQKWEQLKAKLDFRFGKDAKQYDE